MDAKTPRVAGPKGLSPKFKLWLASDDADGAFGDGRWRLLQAVQREGSLMAATEALGISYRKAWGDLRKAERAFGVKLIEKHRGGSEGGETSLTQAGQELVKAYGRFRARVERVVAREFDAEIGERFGG